jgi:ketol-acid reductoisomerase
LKTLHLIGFGSQAQAWAQCLRASGWLTPIYLARQDGPGARKAREELGFETQPLSALAGLRSQPDSLVAMLCPDSAIAEVYRDHLASLEIPLTIILAHGYAVYARELAPARPEHELALLAPKAIGPKIWSLFSESRPAPHRLAAGIHARPASLPRITELAAAMGFASSNLVPATFEQEAMGDLLSEQGLLCGGVFTLLQWTLEAMGAAGVPARLMREECLSELELIAGLLRERGPATTLSLISQAAQCGTVAMNQALNEGQTRARFDAQLRQVLDGRFAARFRDPQWQTDARKLVAELKSWEDRLGPPATAAAPGLKRDAGRAEEVRHEQRL